ncbi:hypothetical protein BS47DRAFT_1343513 [Hydnum rufescens UP504]|uniref:Uncharacterized protein n=1 Tax=Hydnum rufescens UP504 TaxID=1448309 RepID=A0A9P6B0L9_9AGAM|nr:hypothetical protein BS47DRAFT_1343513 [Hydnum rufescens UP504]
MFKRSSIVTQTLLIAVAIWIWQVGRPEWKHFNLAKSNIQTTILTPGYYFAGDANKTCEVITRPDPSRISHCEDGVHIAHKKLLITCDPGRIDWSPIMGIMTNPNKNGAFWIYDYGSEDSLQPVQLVGFPSGRTSILLPAYVFTANLDVKASVVDIFTMSNKAPYKAFYKRTFSHPLIHAPNSLLPISPTQLYISVDHRFTVRMPKWIAKLSLLENILPDGRGWSSHKTERNLSSRRPWHAPIRFYDRDPGTNKLRFREKIPVPFLPDNLRYDSEGNIVVGGHPNIGQMWEVVYGVRPYSPSWIGRISRRKPLLDGMTVLAPDDQAAPFVKASDRIPRHPKYEFKTLYYSDGSQYSCSSTGILDGEELVAMSLLGQASCTVSKPGLR